MTNPLKLFVNFTIFHLKMAGYEFLRTSRGGVMLQDSQQFQYYMKKYTGLFVCNRYKKKDEGCPAIVHHLKVPCFFEKASIHNHNKSLNTPAYFILEFYCKPNCQVTKFVRLPNCQVTKLLVSKLSSYQIISYQIVSYQ